ncbi:MAG: hypothetical protein AB7E45_07920 [Candidatus Caldatribacteriota bacterium]
MPIRVPDPQFIVSLISEINHIYPEQATIYRVLSKTPCPNNDYDPVRNKGINPACPICKGEGYIIEREAINLPVSIEFPDEKEINFLAPGTMISDRLFITIDKKEIDQFGLEVNDIDYILYGGSKYRVKQYREEKLQGIYYELALEVEKIA